MKKLASLLLILAVLPQLVFAVANTHSTDLERDSSQYWKITDASQTGLDFSDAFTISMWVKWESLTSNTSLASKRLATGNQRSWSFHINKKAGVSQPGQLNLAWFTNGSTAGGDTLVTWEPGEASASRFYHIAVSKSGTSIKFYVDGSQQGTTQTGSSATVFNGTADVEIGNFTGDGQLVDGLMDDVRLWARALSDAEIAALHSTPCTASDGANLVAKWYFNNSALDETANNNDLTGVNSPTYSTDVPYVCVDAAPSVGTFYWGDS